MTERTGAPLDLDAIRADLAAVPAPPWRWKVDGHTVLVADRTVVIATDHEPDPDGCDVGVLFHEVRDGRSMLSGTELADEAGGIDNATARLIERAPAYITALLAALAERDATIEQHQAARERWADLLYRLATRYRRTDDLALDEAVEQARAGSAVDAQRIGDLEALVDAARADADRRVALAQRIARRDDYDLDIDLPGLIGDGLCGAADWDGDDHPPQWLVDRVVGIVRPHLARATERAERRGLAWRSARRRAREWAGEIRHLADDLAETEAEVELLRTEAERLRSAWRSAWRSRHDLRVEHRDAVAVARWALAETYAHRGALGWMRVTDRSPAAEPPLYPPRVEWVVQVCEPERYGGDWEQIGPPYSTREEAHDRADRRRARPGPQDVRVLRVESTHWLDATGAPESPASASTPSEGPTPAPDRS